LPIDIQTGKTASLETIKAYQPDTVIVATGANRAAPPIPGKDQRHVFDGNELRGLLFGTDPAAAGKLNLFARLVLKLGQISQLLRSIAALRVLSKFWMPLSKRIILIGGGLVGLELAEYLVARGRRVTVLEPSGNLGAELSIVRRARVVHELREHGVEMLRNADIKEISRNEVSFEIDGELQHRSMDQVIISMGAEPDATLTDAITAAGIQAIGVGDCHEVGYIEGAILAGRKVALSLV
jgi:2,4-dienoyl-CoA reductase (NADPH2)